MSNYKRLFLEQYQYIFITIVTHNRNPILGFYEEDWCNFEDKNKIADSDFE